MRPHPLTFPLRTPPKTTRCLVLALGVGFALATAGCQPPSATSLSSSTLPAPPPPDDEGALRAYAVDLAGRYSAHPDDKAIALAYATALRRLTQNAQAVAILQKLAVQHPHDMSVLAAYGKALADAGRLQEASTVLANAHTPDRPNWTVLSAQGSVADQMGDHAQAQNYYAAALKIVPNQPKVLSNLGLSYALERQMPQAEATLRQAAAQPSADMRIRQNLALVLALEGKYDDAEEVSRRDLSAIDAAQNVHSIKEMIAQSDTWRPIASKTHHVASRETRTRTAAIGDTQ